MEKYNISLIIPMYYDEEIISRCYEKIITILEKSKYNYEVIFISDNKNKVNNEKLNSISSNDKNVKVITFDKNYGQQYAVIAGIKYSEADYLIILDSKLEESIELIPKMFRFMQNKKNQALYINIREEIEIKLYNKEEYFKEYISLLDNEIPKNTGDFRIISKNLIKEISHSSKYNKLTRGLFSWKSYEENPYEIYNKERILGYKKIYKFLGFIGKVLVLSSLLLLLYIGYSAVRKVQNNLPMWMSLLTGMMLFLGIQLVSLNIIAGYLGKANDEYKLKHIIVNKINVKG